MILLTVRRLLATPVVSQIYGLPPVASRDLESFQLEKYCRKEYRKKRINSQH